MSKLTQGIGCLVLGGVIAGAGLQARDYLHLGAPSLPMTCPPGHKVVHHWEKGTADARSAGEITYHGWTEWVSCSDSTTISGG